MTLLSVKGLTRDYPDAYTGETLRALEDVSFSVDEGEFVSILGPSGCGKTTILNVIAGFLPPTEGKVLLRDREIKGPGPDRGVVFQSFALFAWKTVLGNVTFGLKMRGISRADRERIAREYLELVGLGGFVHRYPHELSGGMQQRVGVARVLANDPDVMLMDEPFASVDAQTRMQLQEDLTQIWMERRPTIFFVTHDVEEAVFLSNRVIVLTARPGRVRNIVDVEIPRPRHWKSLIEDPVFRRTTYEIVEMLGPEVESPTDATAP